MGFKKITDAGVQLITEVCKKNNSLFVSNKNFPLPKSNNNITTYTAVIKDGTDNIDTTEKYSQYLIKYINKYSEIFLLDANIIAAQIYVESKFSPVNYEKNNTLGLCGVIDYELYKYIYYLIIIYYQMMI